MNPSFIKILSLLSEIKNNNDPDELNRESDKPDPDKYNQLISRGVKLGLSDIMRKKLAKFVKPQGDEEAAQKMKDELAKAKPSYSLRAPRDEKPTETPASSKSKPTPMMPQRKPRPPFKGPRT